MAVITRLLDAIGWPSEPPTYSPAGPLSGAQAYGTIDLLNDLGLPDFLRGGLNIAGATVTRRSVMRNASVKRSVNLISNAMGMLPCHVFLNPGDGSEVQKATGHPLFNLLQTAPNTKQDAFQYRKLMQRWALIDGDGYSEILRSRGQITGLLPIHPTKVRKREDWNDPYVVQTKNGGTRTIQPEDMFHLYGDSDDGLNGISLIDEAADALGISLQADKAAAALFKNGALIRDVLSKDGKLTQPAIDRLKQQIQDEFSGSDKASKTLVLEEGMKYASVQSNAKESQHLETRKHQVEEVARIFGVPRPFLMVDDTSWGSGIEQLGIFFVQYGVGPWMKAWESAIARSLLTPAERRQGYYAKYNERALLRGSMKDQAEFFSKLMGSGGSPQIMTQNEARGLLDLSDHPEGNGLSSGAMGAANGTSGQDSAER